MSDLYALYRLHKVDSALYGLKMEAEALDLGAEEKRSIASITKDYQDVGGLAKSLTASIKDKELEQKGISEKVSTLNKKMFDGSVVSPREIENMQKEVAMLQALSEKNDERLLQLYEEAPPVVKQAEELKARIESLKSSIERKTAAAVARHGEIKREFDDLRSKRKQLSNDVQRDLLAQYEAVRKRTGSTGIAVVNEQDACEQCGMAVPKRQLQLLREDKVTTCEGCHRILFLVVTAE